MGTCIKFGWRSVLTVLALVWSSGAGAAVVNLTIFNTEPLLDSDGVTTLQGSMFGGDFLQLVHAGGDGMVDPTDVFGLPSGDDSMLGTGNNPSHVGAGIVGPANGLFDEFGIYYDDSLVGTQVYLRFWNAYVMDQATHYGVSDLIVLPAPDAFGMAELDLAPLIGSSRTANFAFSAQALTVPEPSTLYLGALLLFVRRRWRDWSRHGSLWIGILAAFGFQAVLAPDVAAQPGLPLDVMSLSPVETYTGSVLPGAQTDPASASLIQLIDVGSDGAANPPGLDGGPGGDDTLVATGRVGEGVSPLLLESGQFSFAVTPRPAVGARLVVRVYDTPVPGAGARWGQSNVFTVDQSSVFDAGVLGLRAATIPLTADPKTNDADGDGFSDWTEGVANTNASDKRDNPRVKMGERLVRSLEGDTVSAIQREFDEDQVERVAQVTGRAGRRYLFERCTSLKLGDWSVVSDSGVLASDTELEFVDPAGGTLPRLFYRIRIESP